MAVQGGPIPVKQERQVSHDKHLLDKHTLQMVRSKASDTTPLVHSSGLLLSA